MGGELKGVVLRLDLRLGRLDGRVSKIGSV
jgi:hypothetical protein